MNRNKYLSAKGIAGLFENIACFGFVLPVVTGRTLTHALLGPRLQAADSQEPDEKQTGGGILCGSDSFLLGSANMKDQRLADVKRLFLAVVSVLGTCGGPVFADFSDEPRQRAVLYGPQTFYRKPGGPVEQVSTIAGPWLEYFGRPLILHLRNGDERGRRRALSASVSLDGKEVFRDSGSCRNKRELSAAVRLSAAAQLSVRLTGPPGANVTIWIDGYLRAGRALVGPEGAVIMGRRGTASEKFSLRIPPGAFDRPQVVTAIPVDRHAFQDGLHSTVWGGDVVGPVFEVKASAPLLLPAELTLPFDQEAIPDGYPLADLLVASRADIGLYRSEGGDSDAESPQIAIDQLDHTVRVAVSGFSQKAVITARDLANMPGQAATLGCPDSAKTLRALDLEAIINETGLTCGRSPDSITGIVIHSTKSVPGATVNNTMAYGIANEGKAQAHYYVDTDGSVYRLASEDCVAFHAIGYNSSTIGIELVQHYNKDTGVWAQITPEQNVSVADLVKGINDRYGDDLQVLYHSDIDHRIDSDGQKKKVDPVGFDRTLLQSLSTCETKETTDRYYEGTAAGSFAGEYWRPSGANAGLCSFSAAFSGLGRVEVTPFKPGRSLWNAWLLMGPIVVNEVGPSCISSSFVRDSLQLAVYDPAVLPPGPDESRGVELTDTSMHAWLEWGPPECRVREHLNGTFIASHVQGTYTERFDCSYSWGDTQWWEITVPFDLPLVEPRP